MQKLKGFMHVVEIILVVLLAFFVFIQFSSIPKISTDWPKSKLNLLARDMIFSMDRKNVNWFNETEVENYLKTLPSNVIYSVELHGVIKPNIKIGCVCNDTQINELENIFSPGWFVINGKNITIDIQKTDLDFAFSQAFDVVVLMDYYDLTNYEEQIRNYLKYDRGIVEIFDMNESILDSVQKNIFGIDTTDKIPSNEKIHFSEKSKDAKNEIYKALKYFTHLPFFYDDFPNNALTFKWTTISGTPEIDYNSGKPEPSLVLTGEDCGSDNTWIYAQNVNFKSGTIDVDVYIKEGGVFNFFFRFDGRSRSYIASFSANESMGYDSFYRMDSGSIESIGYNISHTTSPNEWHRMRIVVDGNRFELYNDGKKVAWAYDRFYESGLIGMKNLCQNVSVDNVKLTFDQNHEFENFLNQNENVMQRENDENKILLKQYSTNIPACIINYEISSGKGRTVWLSKSDVPEEQKIFIKSVILWASGDTYTLIKRDIKDPVSVSIYKVLNEDMFQPIKIEMKLGYLY
jgi:hypothetical protein